MTLPYPAVNDCLALMDEHEMLDNIRQHSFVVARASENLYNRLSAHCRTLPPKPLVIAGALLHDIAKTACLNSGTDHAQAGADICLELGFTEIAEIVREHVFVKDLSKKCFNGNSFSAKELIFYSDKRVLHTDIVSLKTRLEYILERYGNNDPERCRLIRINFLHCQDLETFLCNCAKCSPEELLEEGELPPEVTRDLL